MNPLTRRQLIRSTASLLASQYALRAGVPESPRLVTPRSTADAIIFINLNGAPSHVDTFDFKPGAWTPHDFNPQSGSGGITLSQKIFPSLLRQSRHLALLRSIEGYEGAHERGQFNLQTGHRANPAFNAETPNIGAVIAAELPSAGPFPPFLSLNGLPTEGGKFLDGRFEPVQPLLNDTGFNLLKHEYFGAESARIFDSRYSLLEKLDAAVRQNPYDPLLRNHAAFYALAKGMMYNDSVVDVFRVAFDEYQRYGDSEFGRACVVARNAVRAGNGVRFVSIQSDGWDMHVDVYGQLARKGRELDLGLGNLIADLDASGHLSRVLIVAMGEFGRTPGALNSRGGRDHHKDAVCALLAGGGLRGARTLGRTDNIGNKIVEPGWRANRPVRLEDLIATFYSALGIDWTKSRLDTPSGRKFQYVPGAELGDYEPVEELFA
jgi:hypothetical protein